MHANIFYSPYMHASTEPFSASRVQAHASASPVLSLDSFFPALGKKDSLVLATVSV